MLKSLKELKGYSIYGRDGEVGKMVDFYFDEKEWVLRYFVVETGAWLSARRVLLSPHIFQIHTVSQTLLTALTMEQIRSSPSWDSAKRVSRLHEAKLNAHYGWPSYWDSSESPQILRSSELYSSEDQAQTHVRSVEAALHLHLEALDGTIGHVEDFTADPETWAVRYLAVDTGHWLPGRKVLISPEWISGMSWEEGRVYVSLDKESIRHSPEYEKDALDREYENRLFRYYKRKKYQDEALHKKSA
jgi:hypothetical protein